MPNIDYMADQKRKTKKPRRTGVPIQFYLSPETFDLLERYRKRFHDREGYHISKTDIGERAFSEFLSKQMAEDSDA